MGNALCRSGPPTNCQTNGKEIDYGVDIRSGEDEALLLAVTVALDQMSGESGE